MIELMIFGANCGQIVVGVHMFGGEQILFAQNCLLGGMCRFSISILRTISGIFTFSLESFLPSLFGSFAIPSFFSFVSLDELLAVRGSPSDHNMIA